MEKDRKKTSKSVIISLALAALIVLVGVEALIEITGNRKNAEKTSGMLMDRIIGVVNQNEQNELSLLESLKEGYIARAQAAAYILEINPDAEKDVKELGRIAKLMSVDEIYILDEKGVIYSGTNEKYFGFNLDSGEQISYFKPMLNDKTLTMCQDVTPNTAEGKPMMYATVWDSTGSKMVQVGIEPVRLLAKLKDSEISAVVQAMPMYEGIEIYVADKENRDILGSSDLNLLGKNIDEIGFAGKDANAEEISCYTLKINNKTGYCAAKEYKDYLIVISQSFMTVNHGLFTSILVVMLYLFIAFAATTPLIISMKDKVQHEKEMRLEEQQDSLKHLKRQFSIIQAVSKDYTDIILIDTKNHSAAMVKVGGKMVDFETITDNKWRSYEDTWQLHIERFVVSEDAEHLFNQIQLDNVEKELESASEFVCGYRIVYNDRTYNYQVKFVYLDTDKEARGSIVASFQNVNDILETERKRAQLGEE